MNTRLQVEHPVTEMITGIDLVKQQILVAEGKPLEIKQEDLKIHGHAIEVRVCAEDPANNFLPEVGTLYKYRPPRGVGIRVDDGFEEGMEIPIYYDNMISKLITYAATREEAIKRMERAIDDFQITGIQTTLGFCKYVLGHEQFLNGKFNTKFVEQYFKPENLLHQPEANEERIAAAFIGNFLVNEQKQTTNVTIATTTNIGISSKWKSRKVL
jgi:acetyl/propionyl-CoA carboxylase alpha subunit